MATSKTVPLWSQYQRETGKLLSGGQVKLAHVIRYLNQQLEDDGKYVRDNGWGNLIVHTVQNLDSGWVWDMLCYLNWLYALDAREKTEQLVFDYYDRVDTTMTSAIL